MKKLFTLAIFAFFSQHVHAVHWVSVGSYEGFSLYVDRDNVRAHRLGNGNIFFSAWVEADFHQGILDDDGQEIWRQTSHIFFDCASKRADINYFENYNNKNTMTRNGSYNLPTHSSADWTVIEPGVAGEQPFNYICSHVKW